jgi:hypothetical protein
LFEELEIRSKATSCTLEGKSIRSPHDCQLIAVHLASNPPTVDGQSVTLDASAPFATSPPAGKPNDQYPSGCNLGSKHPSALCPRSTLLWSTRLSRAATRTHLSNGDRPVRLLCDCSCVYPFCARPRAFLRARRTAFIDKGSFVQRVFWNPRSDEYVKNATTTEDDSMPICHRNVPPPRDYLPLGCPASADQCDKKSLFFWCPKTCKHGGNGGGSSSGSCAAAPSLPLLCYPSLWYPFGGALFAGGSTCQACTIISYSVGNHKDELCDKYATTCQGFPDWPASYSECHTYLEWVSLLKARGSSVADGNYTLADLTRDHSAKPGCFAVPSGGPCYKSDFSSCDANDTPIK